jgi:membrane fusion protein, adhesin transport system
MQLLNSRLPALDKANTSPLAGKIARSLILLFILLFIFLMFTPWQQNVRGSGRVVAFTPYERQQFIGAPVEGRIAAWLVTEGSSVKKGDILAEMLDNDPHFLQRIEAEKKVVLERQTAVDRRVETVKIQLQMAGLARPQALAAANSRIEMAQQRSRAATQALTATDIAQKTSALNLTRQQRLFSKGLSSKRTLELAELENTQRETERERAKATLEAANSEIDALSADARKLNNDTTSTIEKSRADLNKAIEEQNYVKAELLKLETRLARQMTQTIIAPRDGTILRLLTNPGAELIKAGQALAVLVPDSQERAVELWLDGNDMPLVVKNSHVRLQFEGYPAIQFGGWPEFSAGSFGGRISLMDSTDDGKGHFRVLVSPDKDDIPWPEVRFLRQGVRVNGWVLLGQVTLGYELWRIFNGFPPLVLPEPLQPDKPKEDKASVKEDKKDDY